MIPIDLNYKIGIFDSGAGGFTVLKSLQERYPYLNAIYVADTSRVPFGSKTYSEIKLIAKEIIQWLIDQNVDAIVVACNTTNSVALDVIHQYSQVPVFDLIGSLSENNFPSAVGVLATSSTVNSKAYTKRILALNPDAVVLEQPCPELVPLIERCDLDSHELRNLTQHYLAPLLQANVDAIVLGCSHYPLITSLLKEYLPSNVKLIDPAIGLAKQLELFLKMPCVTPDISKAFANIKFCVTADPNGFCRLANYWLGITPNVRLISLCSKACVF